MTPSQQAALEQVARALVYRLTHRDTDWKCCLGDEDAMKIIMDHDASTEARALERAAQIAETPVAGEQDDITRAACDRLARIFRQLAQEQRP